MLGSKCENQPNDRTVQTRSVTEYKKRNAPILKSKERRFIIVTGVLYLIMCIVTLLTTILNIEAIKEIIRIMPSELQGTIEISIIIGCVIGFSLNTFLAVMVFLYKRWAFLVLRIFVIISIGNL